MLGTGTKGLEEVLYLSGPVVKELLGVELGPEAVAVRLELLPLHVVLPSLAQHVLHAVHVGAQLPVDLQQRGDGGGVLR